MPNRDEFFTLAFYRLVAFNTIRIVFILLFAYIAISVAERIIRGLRSYAVKAMLRADGGSEFEVEKRARTVGAVMKKSIAAVVWVIALIMVLKEMNFDVRPLLAGAGVIGLAIGFGAQSLVKDVLAGFFILLDNQIRINDVVVINGTGGLVEEINLRTTILRSEDGAVHVFPNGSIQKLANLTREFSYYLFSVSVNYKDDTDRAVAVLGEIGAQLMLEEPFSTAILAPIEIMGLDQLAESNAVIKARFKTQPMKQWMVGREMNRRINKRFAEVGFASAFPTRTIELSPAMTPQLREELKGIVREVLNERPATSA